MEVEAHPRGPYGYCGLREIRGWERAFPLVPVIEEMRWGLHQPDPLLFLSPLFSHAAP